MSEIKTQRSQLQRGDKAVVHDSSSKLFRLVEVVKTTKTQITCDNDRRYTVETGREIVAKYSYPYTLFAPGHTWVNSGETALDRYHNQVKEAADRKAKTPYVTFFLSLSNRELMPFDIEVLRQAAELLGYQPRGE